MHAFILAGGFATRLWPLTEHRAKPLLPLAGTPILTHILKNIPPQLPVTVSTNAAFAESFETWRQTTERTNVRILIEETASDDRKLGTNGAVAKWIAEEKIDEDVLLLTGDNYLGFSLQKFLDAYEPDTPLLAAYDIGNKDEARRYGTVLTDTDGTRVIGFEEKPAAPKTTLVSTGCYLLPANCLPILTEYAANHPDHIGGIFEEFLRRDINVQCFRFTEPWFDIGSFDAYLEATRTLIGKSTLIDPTATVDDTELHGSVVVGPGCRIRGGTLRDTVLFGDCMLENCVIEDCVIDRACRLTNIDLTGKMLRAGTELHAKA